MHESIRDFLVRMKAKFPDAFRGRVVEFGSYDINGTPREFFEPGTDYRGLDWRPGPGVDVMCLAHEYSPRDLFDTVISTSMLEHDPYWEKTVQRMVKVLKPGGSLLITAAGVGFPAHELHTAPAVLGITSPHYRAISIEDVVRPVLLLRDFEEVVTEEDEARLDARFFFYRSKEEA